MTLNQLVALMEVAGVPPPRFYLPVWPFWIAGRRAGASVPIGVEPPIYRRRVDFYTKSRAFDISRAPLGATAARRPAAALSRR